MAKVIGDISNNAISIATYNEREKINKLGLEKFKLEEQAKALKGQAGNEQQLAAIKQQLTNVQAEITKTQDEIDRAYGIGSEKGMAIRAVTAALQAAAQNDTAGSLVALASPYLNQTIHEMTAGDTAKDKATNLMAHALLSAVEFQVTGKDPLTGAIAGVTGEATAEIIARAYGKPVSELTANEKENISTLSQLAGGLAAALTAKANGTTAEQGGNFLAATAGAETAKRAVENNYLSIADVQSFIRELSKAQKEGRDTKPILEKYKGISEENRQQLIACKGNVACETAHLHEMNTGAEELERNLGFFSRMTVYYPNDLNTANRSALFNLVERENAESFSKLSDTTKFGLNLMEAGTAIGLGAVAGSAKVGLSNVKSLISGKNKAYPTSGMDGYKRANVGDEDYRSSGAENNAKSIPLKEQLSNEMLKAQGTNLEKIDVIARVDVNGRVYVDTNQKARADKFSDPNKLTLIAENVAAKPPLKNGSPYPNSNMENAHAEIGAIQQAYDRGVTKGKSMVINVQGKDVCDYCKNDIATAAEKAGLKSVTVHAIDNRTKLPKVYVWSKGQRSIKEPKNDK